VEIRKLARVSRTMEKEIVRQEDKDEQYEIISENDAAYFNSYENLEVVLNLLHIYFVNLSKGCCFHLCSQKGMFT
jgi:hypothetical protein